jgi:hypothetical protein
MSSSPHQSHDVVLSQIYPSKLKDGFIRLVDIAPGTSSNPIRCTLRTISLASATDTYEAISYVWGDVNNLAAISCNGHPSRIPATLDIALRALRHPAAHRVLWADSICINQDDDEEKGHQAKQMCQVYESAKRVIVYLGPDEYGMAERCFDLIQNFNRAWSCRWEEYGDIFKIPLRKVQDSISADVRGWDEVALLFKSAWFTRLWVVQEAALAKECLMMMGAAAVGFREVIELMLWLKSRRDYSRVTCPHVSTTWSEIFIFIVLALEKQFTWHMELPLPSWFRPHTACSSRDGSFIDMLQNGRFLQATDARDRVYAILGSSLARNEDGSLLVEPDYTRSVEEVYLDLAYALLRHSREAAFVFGAVDHSDAAYILAKEGWPSWAPRWDQHAWTAPLALQYHWYYAGGLDLTFKAEILPCNFIASHGVIFDRLSWVSETLSRGDFSVHPLRWSEKYRDSGKHPIEHLWETVMRECQHSVRDIENVFVVTLMREYPTYSNVPTDGDHMSRIGTNFRAYYDAFKNTMATSLRSNVYETGDIDALTCWAQLAHSIGYCRNRRLARTDTGRLVLTPRFAEPGDICCVFPGASVPYILRKASEDGIYHLVGDSYIYGVMRGEIIQQMEEGKYMLERVLLR